MSNRGSATGGGSGRAVMGALAGVALVVVLAIVFFVVKSSKDKEPTAAAGPAPSAAALDPALQSAPEVKAGEGDVKELKVTPIVTGAGPKVAAGQQLTVNYVGVTYKDGKEFDSSWKTGQPAQFPVGAGQLIEGWDKGLVGVAVGSRVQLDIPAKMAYGDPAPAGRPGGDLRFIIDVLAAQ